MMKWLSRIAVSALLVFGFGCAGGAATADSAEWTRHSEAKLGSLAGQWTGINKLWFMPGDPVRESESECSVTFGAAGTVALISYTWDYEGQSQEGVMMVRAESGTEDVQVSWIDTWHTQSKFMSFEPEEGVEGMVAVRCSYAAPSARAAMMPRKPRSPARSKPRWHSTAAYRWKIPRLRFARRRRAGCSRVVRSCPNPARKTLGSLHTRKSMRVRARSTPYRIVNARGRPRHRLGPDPGRDVRATASHLESKLDRRCQQWKSPGLPGTAHCSSRAP